ncbi:hypothetical protein M0804_003610 [Polistes exclamans]|nr:hypothetical protein M0804_003610 [Polistes exclamans]
MLPRTIYHYHGKAAITKTEILNCFYEGFERTTSTNEQQAPPPPPPSTIIDRWIGLTDVNCGESSED